MGDTSRTDAADATLSDLPPCGPAPSELARAYAALVDRAARAGLLPAGGLTPREQCTRLALSARLPQADLDSLLAILERALYARRADPAEMGRATRQCAALAGRLPDAADERRADPPAPRRSGTSARFLAGAQRWAAPLSLLALSTAGVALALTGELSCAATTRATSDGSPFGTEVASVRAAQGDWATSPNRAVVERARIPPLVMATGTRPTFDAITGRDADFSGQPDPFRPRLSWTHRLNVYPTVDETFAFLPSRGPVQSVSEDAEGATQAYQVDVQLALVEGRLTPLPTPSPDAVFIHAEAELLRSGAATSIDMQFVVDDADAMYVLPDTSGYVRLRYSLASFADYSYAPLPDVPFVPRPQELPPNVRADAERVLGAIGGLPATSFASTIRRLHGYFSGFSVCPIDPDEVQANTFLTIALSRKGVCRHRARTFCIAAMALGIPTRLVENRIHSFAEVQLPDGSWRRLEFRLGEGEQPPVPRTAAARDAGAWKESEPVRIAWDWVGAGAAAVAALILLGRRHARTSTGHLVGARAPAPRPSQRASRNHRRGWQQPSLSRLLDVVRQRLVEDLDAAGTTDDDVRAAVDAADAPRHIRARVEDVLRLGGRSRTGPGPEASILQLAYWNSYHVLHWLDRGRPS